jgi:S1-C subfamily serine protease
MKKRLIIFTIIILVAIFTLPVSAGQTIYELVLSGNSVFVDGKEIKGNVLEYKGTTYIPVDSLGIVEFKDGIVNVKTQVAAEDVAKSITDIFYVLSYSDRWIYGSGVCVAKDTIVTNYHVAGGTSYTQIHRPPESWEFVERIKEDKDKDLVFLKYKANPVKIGDSDKVQIGDPVFVVGVDENENTKFISKGYVLGIDKIGDSNFINTSTVCTYGNSGSGLFNMKGELIGIVTQMWTKNSYARSRPINDVMELLVK